MSHMPYGSEYPWDDYDYPDSGCHSLAREAQQLIIPNIGQDTMSRNHIINNLPKFNPAELGGNFCSNSPLRYPGIWEEIKRDGKFLHTYLFDILSQATPHGEEKLLFPLMKKFISAKLEEDEFGNLWTIVGKDRQPETMFSCHMDTTHHKPFQLTLCKTGGDLPSQYHDFVFAARLKENEEQGENKESKHVVSNLGADDKVGVYILSRMINFKIPGLYCFHVGEERGCVGSKGVVDRLFATEERFRRLKRCIAFDRKGYGDVIWEQHSSRSASDKFCDALATQLNIAVKEALKTKHLDPKYRFSKSTGVFTDSGSYVKVIPECTNLSVGYFSMHSPSEHMDPTWLEEAFIPSLRDVKWDDLPVDRDPKVIVERWTGHNGWTGSTYKPPEYPKWTPGLVITRTTPRQELPNIPASICDIPNEPYQMGVVQEIVEANWTRQHCTIKTIAAFIDNSIYNFNKQRTAYEALLIKTAMMEKALTDAGIAVPIPAPKPVVEKRTVIMGKESNKEGTKVNDFVKDQNTRIAIEQHIFDFERPEAFTKELHKHEERINFMRDMVVCGKDLKILDKGLAELYASECIDRENVLTALRSSIKRYDKGFAWSTQTSKRFLIKTIENDIADSDKALKDLRKELDEAVGEARRKDLYIAIGSKTLKSAVKPEANNVVPMLPKPANDQPVSIEVKIGKLSPELKKGLEEVSRLLSDSKELLNGESTSQLVIQANKTKSQELKDEAIVLLNKLSNFSPNAPTELKDLLATWKNVNIGTECTVH